MKHLLFLGFLLTSFLLRAQGPALLTSAGPAVTVEVSRTYCLVLFVETMAGSNAGHRASRELYEASRFNTPVARRWLRRYQSLDYAPGLERDGYPAGRMGSMGSVEPGYLAAAADARDLPDLQRRTVGLLPNEVLGSLDSVYRYFEPAFDTLAWQPHAAGLARLRTEYAQFLAQSQLMAQFGRLRTFYGSVWPDAVPFRVLLSPQLTRGKDFTNKASVSGNVVRLNCNPAARDFAGGTAVIFHEMSHALSTEQRRGLQQQLARWYLGGSSPNRRYAYNLMEEALATAAGEWIYARQTGQPEAGEWYNDDYINRYAHALYPLVAGYTEGGQTIDSAFVTQAVALFDATFPQAATEYVNLFRNVLYWSDADDLQAAVQPFQDRFRSNYTYTSSPILNADKPMERARGGEFLPVIVVTRAHAATLKYLRQQLPALRAHRLRPEQSFLLSTTGPTGPLILVNAHNTTQLAAAAERLAKQGRIDSRQPLTPLPPAGQ